MESQSVLSAETPLHSILSYQEKLLPLRQLNKGFSTKIEDFKKQRAV